jgi:hypothetical protein
MGRGKKEMDGVETLQLRASDLVSGTGPIRDHQPDPPVTKAPKKMRGTHTHSDTGRNKKKKKSKRASTTRNRGGASIPCPVCGSPTRVLATRRSGGRFPGKEGQVYRRRLCKHRGCQAQFQTLEKTMTDVAGS